MKLSLLFLLITGILTGLTGAMIPGPLTLFTVSEVLKRNKMAGMSVIAGHALIEFLLVVAIFLGFQNFLLNEKFTSFVSLIGGAALLFMGILLLRGSSGMKISILETGKKINNKGLIAGGILFSVSSPGFIIWWMTIGLSTIAKASLLGITGIAVLIAGHYLADFVWYGLLSFAVEKGKLFLNDAVYQKILKIFALLLSCLGIVFLFQAF